MNSSDRPLAAVPRWQRWLLPAEMLDHGEPPGDGRAMAGPPRSLRDWMVDVLVFGCSLALGVLILAQTWHQHATAIGILDGVLGVVACLLLWGRRSRPLVVALFAISVSSFSAMAAGAALVSIFNVAVYSRLQTLAWVTALSLLCTAVYPALYNAHGGYDPISLLVGVLLTGIAIGWGLFARARRQLVASLHDRARQLESEHRLRVAQGRQAERAQIAREMHDVLAHRISLLSVYAGALEFRPDAPPEEIARAAGVIRAAAHAALEELREVIGVLREADGDAGNGRAIDGRTAPERPQPTLGQVPELIEESRRAGMQVRLALEPGEADAIPDATARTVYRIVQEGLTNARKHAPASLVDVEIVRDSTGRLAVSVRTRPSVGAGVAQLSRTAALPGSGLGLIGLAERVTLAGGSLEHQPTPDGGYDMRATLPLPA